MQEESRNEMRKYAWQYFSLHSDQRLKTFNFYLILVTVVLGGLLAFIKDAKVPQLGAPAGLLLAFLSFIFWKLDRRNRELIQHSEDILKRIENDIPTAEVPAELRLFMQEQAKTDEIRTARRVGWNPRSWFKGHYSYSDCFRAMFWMIGILGVATSVGTLFLGAPKEVTPVIPQQQFFIGSWPSDPTHQKAP
jgi:hypothetical protein